MELERLYMYAIAAVALAGSLTGMFSERLRVQYSSACRWLNVTLPQRCVLQGSR
jgi:hypothetical protein